MLALYPVDPYIPFRVVIDFGRFLNCGARSGEAQEEKKKHIYMYVFRTHVQEIIKTRLTKETTLIVLYL